VFSCPQRSPFFDTRLRWIWLLVPIAAMTAAPAPAPAQTTLTWDGGAGDGLWSSPNNWNPDQAPIDGDILIFDGTGAATTNDAVTALTSITFNTGGFTLNGYDVTLTNSIDGIIINNKSGTNTINFNLALGSAGTIATSSGTTLTVNGTLDTLLDRLTVNSAGTCNLNGAVVGFGGIDKSGNGTLNLAGANIYTGGTTLNAGTLGIGSNTALGTALLSIYGGTLVASGAARTIENSIEVHANFTIGGSQALTQSNPWATTYNTLWAPVTITVSNSALTTLSAPFVDWYGANSITKSGTGALVLGADNSGAFASVSLNQGTLRVGHDNALGGAVPLTIAGGTTIQAEGAARTLPNTPLTINGNFTIAGTYNLELTGGTTLAAARTITVSSTGIGILSGAIGGTGPLAKDGSGTLVLAGANSYSGTTTIARGILGIGHDSAVPGAAISVTGPGGLMAWGAPRTLAHAITAASTLTVTGSENLTLNGAITAPVAGITREIWTGIGGGAVNDLRNNANYPNNPTLRDTPATLEGSTNWADTYGTRFRGYFVPTATNTYYFAIAADDSCELWLSPNDDPAGAVRIAYSNSWTNSREYNKYASTQQSAGFTLTAGRRYYIEALMKENSGGDNIAVAAATATPIANGTAPIDSTQLLPYLPTLLKTGDGTLTLNNANTLSGASLGGGTVVMGHAGALGAGAGNLEFNGGALDSGGASRTLSNPVIVNGNATLSGTGDFTFNGTVTLNVAAQVNIANPLTVFNGVVSDAGLLREYWTGVGGTAVTNLTSNANYPNNPTGFSFLTHFECPSGWADNYGTRVRGYFIPTETGDHYFALSSDDNSELWISTDADPANKVLVANVPGTQGRWPNANPQRSNAVPMVAGQRYYIEGLQKEGGGGDYFAAAVKAVATGAPAPSFASGDPSIRRAQLRPFAGQPILTKTGAGTLRLAAANDYAGTAVAGGTVQVANDLALGTGPIDLYNGATLAAYGAPRAFANRLKLAGDCTIGGAAAGVDDFAVTFAGDAILTGNRTVTIANSQTTFSGVISGGRYGLSKAGTGTMIFSGTSPNTYLGQTTVLAGSLVLAKTPGLATSGLFREYWTGISGSAVSNLTGNANYPDNPSGFNIIPNFECPTGWADNYGTRVRGYFIPSVTGDHYFSLSSDDESLLYLSPDADPSTKVQIARANVYGRWPNSATGRSSAIPLVAGRRYYIEALMKEGGGGDYLAVAVNNTGTFDPADPPIQSAQLAPYYGPFVVEAGAVLSVAASEQIADSTGVTLNGGTFSIADGLTETVGPLTLNGGTVAIGSAGAATLVMTSNIAVTASALISGPGTLDLGGAARTFTIPAGAVLPVTAVLAGATPLVKNGAGTLTLGADSSLTFTGATSVAAGTLAVTGSIAASAVDVQGGATLAGTGTTGPLTVQGGSLAPGLAGPGRLTTQGNLTVFGPSGSIRREIWQGIGGTAITDLTNNANYPNNPTTVDYPTEFEGQTNWADNYGTRMRGWFTPLVTGPHYFAVAADDACELWLSPDGNPSNKTRIAYSTAWTNSREYRKYSTQQSGAIPLVAGQWYYIEALMKEGGGGDNFAVAVSTTGQPANGDPPIPGSQLSYYLPTSTYAVELNGPTPAAQYDQVAVNGAVALGGGTLSISLGYTPAADQVFTLIDNDGADAVAGTFADLFEGAVIQVGSRLFEVSYVGGDGNDVTLKDVSSAPPKLVAAVTTNGIPYQVQAVFNKPLDPASAQNASNYAIDNGIAVQSAVLGANGRTVTLTVSTLASRTAAGALITYTLTVAPGTVKDVLGNAIAAPDNVKTFQYEDKGFISREYWTGIGGTEVANLTSNVNFVPTTGVTTHVDNPSGGSLPTQFEAPNGWADNYGTRMRGYFYPPTTGTYYFAISSDDDSDLYVCNDSDPDPANPVYRNRIAYTEEATGSREYNKFASQKSGGQAMTAGKKYYIEALQKEGSGGDHLAVAYRLGDANFTNGDAPIPGSLLSPYLTPAAVTAVTINGKAPPQTVEVSQPVTFSATVTGSAPRTYQWQKDGADIPGATGKTYAIAAAAITDSGTYRVRVTNPACVTYSAGAVLTVVNDATPPRLESVIALSDSLVRATFTEPVTKATAETIGRYTISPSETIASATLVPPGSLVGWWKLDEAASPSADSAPDPANGAWAGAPAQSSDVPAPIAGFSTASIALNASGEHVNLGNAAKLALARYTIAGWIKTSGTLTRQRVVTSRNASSTSRTWWISVWGSSTDFTHANGALAFRTSSNGTGSAVDIGSGATLVNDGQWHHFAAVLDGSKAAYLYVDGVLRATDTSPGVIVDRPDVAAYIGDDPTGGSDRWFDGGIDDFRIYDYALTASQVAALYAGTETLPFTASDTVDLSISTTLAPDPQEYLLTVQGVEDPDANPIPAPGSSLPFRYYPTGQVYREWWTGIGGGNVTDLTGNVNYPDDPGYAQFRTALESPPSPSGDNYGSRYRGFFHPPSTGYYWFTICSDDYSDLWLSTDDKPSNAIRVCYANGATNPMYTWSNGAPRRSPAIPLVAGRRYYIEVLHKEGGGDDHVEVAYDLDGTFDASNVSIPGTELTPYLEPIFIRTLTESQTVEVGQSFVLSVTVTGSGGNSAASTLRRNYSWEKETAPDVWTVIGLNRTYAFASLSLSDSGNYRVRITNPVGTTVSPTIVLTVADTSPPSIATVSTPDATHVAITFTEPVEAVSALTLANYALSHAGGAVAITGAVQSADRRTVTLAVDPLSAGIVYTLTVANIGDDNGNVMGQETRQFQLASTGAITLEWFLEIGGGAVANLTSSSKYPDRPDGGDFPATLDLPSSLGDNYGTRWRGYVHPSVEGDYYFAIASDDNSSLLLSTDDSPANAVQIAAVPGYTNKYEWTKYQAPGEQISGPVHLLAGQRYYIEALHKEGGGGDHVAVACSTNVNDFAVLDASRVLGAVYLNAPQISPYIIPLAITAHPESLVVEETQPASFTVSVTGTAPRIYTWQKYDPAQGLWVNILNTPGVVEGADTATLSILSCAFTDDGRYRVTVSNPRGNTVTSDAAILAVMPDINPPRLRSVTAAGVPTRVLVVFDEFVEETSAETPGNYAIYVAGTPPTPTGIVVSGAELLADKKTVRLILAAGLDPAPQYLMVVNNVTDQANPPNVAAPDTSLEFRYFPSGGITREYWTGINGTSISDLTGNPNYPNNASNTGAPTDPANRPALAEAPTNWADNYGTRLRGYFIPAVTGDHYFAIASDDASELWLNKVDDDPTHPINRQRIALVSDWTNSREYNHSGEYNQTSAAIPLTAGQRYYIEAFQKEGGGGDNLAVAVLTGLNQIRRWAQSTAEACAAASTKSVETAGGTTLGWYANTGDTNRLVHSAAAFAPAAGQAIAFDAYTSQGGGNTATLAWNHAVNGTLADRLLVVGVTTELGVAVASVTYGGTPLSLVSGSVCEAWDGSNLNGRTELWYLLAPAGGTNEVLVTLVNASARSITAGAISLGNVAQQAAEAVVTNVYEGDTSSLTTSITTLTNGAWLVDVVHAGNPVTLNPILIPNGTAPIDGSRLAPHVDPPYVLRHPASRAVNTGETVSFSVSAAGTCPRTYQWQKYDPGTGAWLDLADGGAIGGSATVQLTITGVAASHRGAYRVRIANGAGTLYSNPATLDILNLPAPTLITWTGSASNDWNTAANWSPAAVPVGDGTEELVFPAGPSNRSPNDAGTAAKSFYAIHFNGDGYAIARTGTTILTGPTGIKSSAGTANAFNTRIALLGNTEVKVDAGTALAINGVFDNSFCRITAQVDGTCTMAGAVLGTGGLVKKGAGTLVLASPASTYSGGTELNEGTIAFGASSTVTGGGALVSGPLGTRSLVVKGTSVLAASGAARIVHNVVRLDGALTLAGSYQLELAGSMTLPGAQPIVVTCEPRAVLSGVLGGPGSLLKQGAGVLQLRGLNTYAGGTSVQAGTLELNGTAPSGTIPDNGAVSLDVAGTTLAVLSDETMAGLASVAGSLISIGSGAELALDVPSGSTSTVAGLITSAADGALYKLGDGHLSLAGPGPYVLGDLTVGEYTGWTPGDNTPRPAGTLFGGSAKIVVQGNFVQAAGTVECTSGILEVRGGFTQPLYDLGSGNFVPVGRGRFHPNNGTVLLAGAASRTIVAPFSTGDTASAFHSLVINDGLAGYWTFDETAGSEAEDASGYGNHGAHANGPIPSTDTPAGTTPSPRVGFADPASLSFDGVDDHVSVPDHDSLNPTSGITISVWVKTDNWGDGRRIVQKGGQDRLTTEGGQMTFVVNGAGIVTAPLPMTGAWHHVAATYNDATNALALYVDAADGAADGTGVYAGGAILPSTEPLCIGAASAASPAGERFLGLIDDLRIYTRALAGGAGSPIQRLASGLQPAIAAATFAVHPYSEDLRVLGDFVVSSGYFSPSAFLSVQVGGDLRLQGGTVDNMNGIYQMLGTGTGNTILCGQQILPELWIGEFVYGGGTYAMADQPYFGTLFIYRGTLTSEGLNVPITLRSEGLSIGGATALVDTAVLDLVGPVTVDMLGGCAVSVVSDGLLRSRAAGADVPVITCSIGTFPFVVDGSIDITRLNLSNTNEDGLTVTTADPAQIYSLRGIRFENINGGSSDPAAFLRVATPGLVLNCPGCYFDPIGPAQRNVTVATDAGIHLYFDYLGIGTVLEDGADLATTASSATVTSAGSAFATAGLQPGHRFRILGGADAGYYTVVSVVSETQVTLDRPMTATAADVAFQAGPNSAGPGAGEDYDLDADNTVPHPAPPTTESYVHWLSLINTAADAIVNDGPTPGVDLDYQTSTTSFSANWSGFGDHEAFIANYAWSVRRVSDDADMTGLLDAGLAKTATASVTLDSGESYYVYVRATFTDGSTAEKTSDGMLCGTEEVTLTFPQPGYHLIALPVEPTTPFTANSLALAINAGDPSPGVTRVLRYNGTGYDVHTVGAGSGFGIVVGEGYFIRTTAAGSWTLRGIPLNAASAQLQIRNGYNLVGLPRIPLTPYTAEAAIQEINAQGGNATRMLRYNGTSYEVHTAGSGSGFTLIKGEGYFIRATVDSWWTLQRP